MFNKPFSYPSLSALDWRTHPDLGNVERSIITCIGAGLDADAGGWREEYQVLTRLLDRSKDTVHIPNQLLAPPRPSSTLKSAILDLFTKHQDTPEEKRKKGMNFGAPIAKVPLRRLSDWRRMYRQWEG